MAPPIRGESPADKAFGSTSIGILGDGTVHLSDGSSFHNVGDLVRFMRNNPGYVYKHRRELRTLENGRYFALAGYNLSGDGDRMQQFDGVPGQSGKLIRAWTPSAREKAVLDKRGGPDAVKTIKVSSADAAPSKPSKADAAAARNVHDRPVQTVSTPAADAATASASVGPTGGAVDPGTAMTSGLSKRAQSIIANALGTKLPGAQPVNVNALVGQLGSNYSDDLISSLAGSDSINRSIDYLKSLVDQNTRDTAQAGRNIDSWYGEVGNSLATAASRDKAINAASLSSIQDVSKGIASAIGGEAAPGAGQVAATGAQGAQLIGAMGNINNEYNSDLAPLIQMEAAGAKSQATSEGAQRAADLQGQIIDQENTRDKNVADARVQLAQLNHGLDQQRATTRLQAMGFNNDIGQQAFQNNLARGQSLLAAANFGLDVTQLGANINTNAAKIAASTAIAGQKSADARSKARAKALAPPSASSLRDSYKTAFQAVNALRQTGALNPQNGIQAVKSAYGITAQSNRAARQAAYTAAQQALPGVQVDRRWFGLGA